VADDLAGRSQTVLAQRREARRRAIRRRRILLASAGLAVAAAGVAYASLGGSGGSTKPRVAVLRPEPAAASARTQVRHASPLLALPPATASRTVSLPILMYHRIDLLKPTLPPITHRLTVDPTDFARQMRWLRRHGYHAVKQQRVFAALAQRRPLPTKPILITFDDGYRDVLKYAAPVLERLQMPAIAYVITGRVGGPDPSFLTWHQLSVLEQRGIAIGSHTVTHADLTALGDARALAELKRSRAALERHLRHPVQWFAYPFGAEDARVVRLVRRAGYVLAVTTQSGFTQDAAHPLELRRTQILDSTGVAGLAALLSG